jgi:hypothetical protein
MKHQGTLSLLFACCVAATAAAASENCQTIAIIATDITYQVDTPSDVNASLCNNFFSPPRCPGTKEVVSSPVITALTSDEADTGWYNIADTYTALTTPERFVRIGHGSFVFADVGSLYLQSFQDCNANQTECYTRIAITGGDGKYDCAVGTVEFRGQNTDQEIEYDASFCSVCQGSSGCERLSLGLSFVFFAVATVLLGIIF